MKIAKILKWATLLIAVGAAGQAGERLFCRPPCAERML